MFGIFCYCSYCPAASSDENTSSCQWCCTFVVLLLLLFVAILIYVSLVSISSDLDIVESPVHDRMFFGHKLIYSIFAAFGQNHNRTARNIFEFDFAYAWCERLTTNDDHITCTTPVIRWLLSSVRFWSDGRLKDINYIIIALLSFPSHASFACIAKQRVYKHLIRLTLCSQKARIWWESKSKSARHGDLHKIPERMHFMHCNWST